MVVEQLSILAKNLICCQYNCLSPCYSVAPPQPHPSTLNFLRPFQTNFFVPPHPTLGTTYSSNIELQIILEAPLFTPRAYRLFKERTCNSTQTVQTKNSNKCMGGRGFAHACPIAKCIYSILFLVTISNN